MNEGNHTLIAQNGSIRVEIVAGYGDNNLILCSSLCDFNLSREGRPRENSYGIEIQYPSLFAAAISKKLFEMGYAVVSSVIGPCHYQSNKNIEACGMQDVSKEYFGFDEDSVNFDIMFRRISEMSGIDGYFTKEKFFQHEHEFRFVWLLQEDIEDETLIIKVPEAIKYCTKIELNVE